MTYWRLLWRSLRFHARAHLGTLLGAAIGSAVLTGALLVGDSVSGSLRAFALARIGKIELALAGQDRFFRAELADDLARLLNERGERREVAPAVQLLGTAAVADGSARANRVQLLGVDERFWRLSRGASPVGPPPDAILLNDQLASQLGVRTGDAVVVRVPKPSQLSLDAPVAPQEETSVSFRLTVAGVVGDEALGRFSLHADQKPPFNAFVNLAWLQTRLELPGRANLLLAGGAPLTLAEGTAALARAWQLADAQLEVRILPAAAAVEVRSSRVFLDAPVSRAALEASPQARGILTYFVNELRVGERRAPYSMVTAIAAPAAGLRDDEILINQWLAADLQAQPGAELELDYYLVGPMRQLEERTARFRVRAIYPMTSPLADRSLMPDFPGLTEAENCRDWDAGFPIDTDRIREKDEQYWDEYRGAPKAVVTLAAGQTLWTNRFGNLTAVRYSASGHEPEQAAARVRAALRQRLAPDQVGLAFQPLRERALAASAQGINFGPLFLGFSFFLIAAALLLMGLLFQLGLERRSEEVGTLLALGFRPGQVRGLLLAEGAALALAGGLLGLAGGLVYAQGMIYGLSTIWREAIAGAALQFHVEPATLWISGSCSTAVAVVVIALTLRRQARQPARELLQSAGEEASWRTASGPRRFPRSRWLAAGTGAAALGLAAWAAIRANDQAAAGIFFAAAALMLVAGLAVCAVYLDWLARPARHRAEGGPEADSDPRLSLAVIARRNLARRPKRSLTTAGLLACGCFLIVAVGAQRLEAERDAQRRDSGTGGFALIGESVVPVVQDLNTAAGREFYGLDSELMRDVRVVPLRLLEGDDASCLNLNRAQTPRLLGVRPEALVERGAFRFVKADRSRAMDSGWLLLRPRSGDDAVPAIGDAASIQWALGKKIGDTLEYLDEQGRPFKVRLAGAVANSILQGSLVIAEDEFVARFPNRWGYRTFLIDAPSNRLPDVAAGLARALQDYGLELSPASRRLAEFNAVQNTYLSTFQVLGGLGLLLGSAGLGLVVLRNALERRTELAVLTAIGLRRAALKRMVLAEHAWLLLLGFGTGLVAAGVAVWPALRNSVELPFATLALTLAAILINGLAWTWGSTQVALRGKLLEALRNN